MNERAKSRVAFSHMALFAAVSVLALFVVSALQIYGAFGGVKSGAPTVTAPANETSAFSGIDWQAPEPGIAPDGDGLVHVGKNVMDALITSYATLEESGVLTPETAEDVGLDLAESLRARLIFTTYTAADLATEDDTSYERMLAYRADMRVALEPLLKNGEYELKLFASYQDTKDQKYIEELVKTAENYREAVSLAANVVVPTDAIDEHLAVLNSLSEFGATIQALAKYADDPFAVAALLQSYGTAESSLMTSFDALATYQKKKTS